MKRLCFLLFCFLLIFGMCACTEKQPEPEQNEEAQAAGWLPGDHFSATKTVRGVIYGLDENGHAVLIGTSDISKNETMLILKKEPEKGYLLTEIRAHAFDGNPLLSKLYYEGSPEDLSAVSLPEDLPDIYSYAIKQPLVEGNYWYYGADDRPAIWHYHHFNLSVQAERYLMSPAACGERAVYYLSCACGERGDYTFEGSPEKHRFGVVVNDDGVIEKVYCTRGDCGYMEKLNFELPTVGTFYGSFDCSAGDPENDYTMLDSAKIFYYEKCSETDYNTYVQKMKEAGCVEKATYKMGKNLYTLLAHETFTAYVSYLSDERGLRVYVGRSDDVNPSKVEVADAGICKPALWQINVNCEAAKSNGGMSYVMQLTDGKFLIVDGGYRTKEDADSIYEILVTNKPKTHEKPVIAGWFFTHTHIDHVGAFRTFTTLYRDAVVVEGFYYNFLYTNVGDIWPNNSRAWENEMRTSYPSAVCYRKLHSGEQFFFSGAKVTVICTCEDNYPWENRNDDAPASHFKSGNDTSLVFKVEAGGQSVLFLGDAEYGESDRMMHLDKDVLHADILQYAHHGYDHQCRNELYKKIDPTVVLWPMTIVNWESESHGEVFRPRYVGTEKNSRKENAWIRSATSVKKIIVMAEGTTKLVLPYTPTGPRDADYVALYKAQKPKN